MCALPGKNKHGSWYPVGASAYAGLSPFRNTLQKARGFCTCGRHRGAAFHKVGATGCKVVADVTESIGVFAKTVRNSMGLAGQCRFAVG